MQKSDTVIASLSVFLWFHFHLCLLKKVNKEKTIFPSRSLLPQIKKDKRIAFCTARELTSPFYHLSLSVSVGWIHGCCGLLHENPLQLFFVATNMAVTFKTSNKVTNTLREKEGNALNKLLKKSHCTRQRLDYLSGRFRMFILLLLTIIFAAADRVVWHTDNGRGQKRMDSS